MGELKRISYKNHEDQRFDDSFHSQLRRVALDCNGQVQGIHHVDDYDKWNDGTEIDWSIYESNGWNCMVQIPKFYYRYEQGEYNGIAGVLRVHVSGVKKEGYTIHPAFLTRNGEQPFQYVGAFQSSLINDVLRSLPNKTVHSITMSTINDIANVEDYRFKQYMNTVLKNGDKYRLMDTLLVSMLQMLVFSETAIVNYSEQFGALKFPSGVRSQTGLGPKSEKDITFSTTIDQTTYAEICYRGVENLLSKTGTLATGMSSNGSFLFEDGGIYYPSSSSRDRAQLSQQGTYSLQLNHNTFSAGYLSGQFKLQPSNKSAMLFVTPATADFRVSGSNVTSTNTEFSTLDNASQNIQCNPIQLNKSGLYAWGGYYSNIMNLFKISCYSYLKVNPRIAYIEG